MTEQDDLFIVRAKLAEGAWWYWANPYIDDAEKSRGRRGENWYKPERLEDYDHLILKLEDARKFVQDQLKFSLVPWHHYQIRPWFCESNDPRIEDYPLVPEPAPEILITIEGGLIQEMLTTATNLRVLVIDNDLSDIGENPISEHQLTGDPNNRERIQLFVASALTDYEENEGLGEDTESSGHEWNL